jgi:hypothetical protein
VLELVSGVQACSDIIVPLFTMVASRLDRSKSEYAQGQEAPTSMQTTRW